MTEKEFIKIAKQNKTLVSKDRLSILYNFCNQAEGEVWECGVYKGGTAVALSKFGRTTRLFDTFEGMPQVSRFDNYHRAGDFKVKDDVISKLKADNVSVYKGYIPETFKGLEDCQIGFAHIDVDIYQSVMDCCQFIEPRLIKGGIMIFDDYGFRTCKGAKLACDTYFGDKLIRLKTKQAMFIK